MKLLIKYIIVFFVLLLSSCVSYTSLKNFNDEKVNEIFSQNTNMYKLAIGDILNIKMTSLQATNTDLFSATFDEGSLNFTDNALYLKGYVIDNLGNIDVPYLGKVNVVGKTIDQVKDTLECNIKDYITFSSIKVILTNSKITILGEVRKPGLVTFNQSRLNLVQAIGLAGDFNETADRKKIRIFRYIDGHKKVMDVDLMNTLNDIDIWPNDIIYVEPLKIKALRVNTLTIQTVISLITFTFLLINYISK